MALQTYALTGRRPHRRNYVDEINAKLNANVLGRKKTLADTEQYRADTLALNNRAILDRRKLEEDKLNQAKDSADRSALVGLGQTAIAVKNRNASNKAIKEIIDGGSGKGMAGGAKSVDPAGMGPGIGLGPEKTPFLSKEGLTDVGGWKEGAGNWSDIASGVLAGAPTGAKIAEKVGVAPWVGGGTASAGLSYLSSGDPYTAALSFVGGSLLGSMF